ncbi:MAG TPA: DUF2703 domain-containing protein [Ignavibacteriales bacterium]|nr:DUF2703 domain-containing protein [Ignavibacteriales bacterium]
MKLRIEYQYFEGCPNHRIMGENLKGALEGLEDKIELKKVLVEDEATAKQVGFRGSPTLLINGEDIEGVPARAEPSLSCRFYVNGIPSSDEIKKIIIEKINME